MAAAVAKAPETKSLKVHRYCVTLPFTMTQRERTPI